MRQQNTGSESNREAQIDPAIGFSAAPLSLFAAANCGGNRCLSFFGTTKAVAVMQKVHRLTHN
jgi:hypothetical protein